MLHTWLGCSNSLLLQKKKMCLVITPLLATRRQLWDLSSHTVKWFDSLPQGKNYLHFCSVIVERRIRQVWNWMVSSLCKEAGRPHGKTQGRRKSSTVPLQHSQFLKGLVLYHVVRHQCAEIKEKLDIYIINYFFFHSVLQRQSSAGWKICAIYSLLCLHMFKTSQTLMPSET